MFVNILSSIFANAFAFSEAIFCQKSPRVCQGSGRNRQNSNQLLHIHQRQEFSGVRRLPHMRTTIRRTPQGVLACISLFSLTLQKPSWAGILHSYRPREGRRTRPETVAPASFFASFFWSIFGLNHFCASLRTPKIIKNRTKHRYRKPSFFRAYASQAFLPNFSSFWMILRMQNVCVFHWQVRQNMHSHQKWALAVPGPILTSF